MVHKWNNQLIAFQQIKMSDELKHHIRLFKKNAQPDIMLDGCILPSPKQRYDRKKHLCKLIDCIAQISIGRYVLQEMLPDVRIISLDIDSERDILGGYVEKDKIINVLPKVFCYPVNVQINVLVHEAMHAIHKQMEKDIQNQLLLKNYSKLNVYDQFVLKFLSETACCINGQLGGLCAVPQQDRKVVNIRPLFYNKDYWQMYYDEALDVVQHEKNPKSCLQAKHTLTYYAIVQSYFKLHPELRDARLMRRIHRGWQIFSKALSAELECATPQKVASQSVYSAFGSKISSLVEQAINIKT